MARNALIPLQPGNRAFNFWFAQEGSPTPKRLNSYGVGTVSETSLPVRKLPATK